jgi:NAD(P)H-hydrate epimerase
MKIETLQLAQFSSYLTPRQRDSHKSLFGHVLVVGGERGFAGAPRLAAEAALRIGAGLVSVATRPEHAGSLTAERPEVMCHGITRLKMLTVLLNRATLVVVGPGLGQSSWAKKVMKCVIKSKKPLVMDADALNLLAQSPFYYANWVLTPHPGEAARLLQTTNDMVQSDRLAAVRALQKKYGGICVLKGKGTIVAADGSALALCEAGNPGMATAGMGDVLSGVIGGLAAQGIPLPIAAKLGVLLHATAGDLAAAEKGERGMIASDLVPYLRRLVNP